MRRSEHENESVMGTIKSKFKDLWKYYILQSLLAAVVLFILVFILGDERMLAFSAMGATTFIVFAMPKSSAAKTRNVIGGHLVGLACGLIFLQTSLPHYFEYPLAIGVVMFLMVALDVEHPPAAGTALAVLANEVTLNVFVTIMITAVFLSQCRYFIRKYLKDLV